MSSTTMELMQAMLHVTPPAVHKRIVSINISDKTDLPVAKPGLGWAYSRPCDISLLTNIC